jgi:hypothetical protein
MARNNPVNLYDQYGLLAIAIGTDGTVSFEWYGKWGGPGWAGGQWVNDGWNSPASPNYVPALSNVAPVDDLDTCYKRHDECYEKCRTNNTCSVTLGGCFSRCDYASVPCQLQALYGNNYWNGYLQAIPGAIALGGQGVARGNGAALGGSIGAALGGPLGRALGSALGGML